MSAKLKVLVLGARGMLGSAVVEASELCGHETTASNLDVRVAGQLQDVRVAVSPDVVINCAGVIPLKNSSPSVMVGVNALAPHLIAAMFDASHVVQVSTDCVYSGKGAEPHGRHELPDPNSLYGKSKLAGELIDYPNATTVRTSFIGPTHGLLPWFLSQTGQVVGWDNATWSGSTHKEVARHLVRIAEERVGGLVHLAASPTTKFWLLKDLSVLFNHKVRIVSERFPYINRALEPTQYMLPVTECAEDLR